MFFNGGMRLVMLNAITGKKISETILDEVDPETGDREQETVNLPDTGRRVLHRSNELWRYMATPRIDGRVISRVFRQSTQGAADVYRHI